MKKENVFRCSAFAGICLILIPPSIFHLHASDQAATPSTRQQHQNAGEFIAHKKSTGCAVNGRYPDAGCTPGVAMGITVDEICGTSTKGRRNVTSTMRKQIYESYGFSFPQSSGIFEVDHFIPLELGGSNDIGNLWPEAANPTPGFHQKDCVEDYLHAQVCKTQTMTLADAQKAIVSDWYKVFEEKAKGSGIGQCKTWGK